MHIYVKAWVVLSKVYLVEKISFKCTYNKAVVVTAFCNLITINRACANQAYHTKDHLPVNICNRDCKKNNNVKIFITMCGITALFVFK